MEAYVLRMITAVSSMQVLRSIWLGQLSVTWLLLVVANFTVDIIKTKERWKKLVDQLEWLKTYNSQPLVTMQLVLSLVMLRNSVLCEVHITIDALTAAALVAIQMCIPIRHQSSKILIILVAFRLEGTLEGQACTCLLLALLVTCYLSLGVDWQSVLTKTVKTLEKIDRQPTLRKKASLTMFIDLWPTFISRD